MHNAMGGFSDVYRLARNVKQIEYKRTNLKPDQKENNPNSHPKTYQPLSGRPFEFRRKNSGDNHESCNHHLHTRRAGDKGKSSTHGQFDQPEVKGKTYRKDKDRQLKAGHEKTRL